MFRCIWDRETGGVKLVNLKSEETLSVSPRPVFYEELDLLGLDAMGWKYPRSKEPLMWACNKQYFYRGELMFEAKGANIYDKAQVVMKTEKKEVEIEPVDVEEMLRRCGDEMFLIESEAIEFIRDTHQTYSAIKKIREKAESNKVDLEELRKRLEKKRKREMAIVKEDCDSFDIMPLEEAENEGKKVLQTTAKIDVFLASFSGGKDSQVVLDLCTRALMPTDFQVIYSDTGYELPPSLELYEEVKRHYGKLYPELLFRTAKNHAPVLEYWDKIGTPSDTHRWCCSVMKTAPLYRMLKVEGTNKQARVLTFDGVRAEESVRRAGYARIGKGKHTTIINTHPILDWNTTEIFLYLFKYELPINIEYRLGKARVGCVICPFSSAWDDMIINASHPKELSPFIERILKWAKIYGVKDTEIYLKDRKWKLKATGDKLQERASVNYTVTTDEFCAEVQNSQNSIYVWMPVLGEFTFTRNGNKERGEVNIKGRVYEFNVVYENEDKNYVFRINYGADPKIVYLLKRVINKSAYCIQCEVCEVDCPTGALTVYPNISISKKECIHCFKCLDSHEMGCVVCDNARMTEGSMKKAMSRIEQYKTFGFREEWINDFFNSPDTFWSSNGLGSAQVDGFKCWLRDAEIIDSKGNISKLGNVLKELYLEERIFVWELILVNLSYNSFISKWFVNNISVGQQYDKAIITDSISSLGLSASAKSISNAAGAWIQTLKTSPIGSEFVDFNAKDAKHFRKEYNSADKRTIAYLLYRYAQAMDTTSLRITDLYSEDCENSPLKIFGMEKQSFIDALHSLNSDKDRVLTAELNMGLEHITLREGMSALEALKIMTNR